MLLLDYRERKNSEESQPLTEADLDKMNIVKSGITFPLSLFFFTSINQQFWSVAFVGRLWIGKDYCNEIRQGFVKGAVESPDEG